MAYPAGCLSLLCGVVEVVIETGANESCSSNLVAVPGRLHLFGKAHKRRPKRARAQFHVTASALIPPGPMPPLAVSLTIKREGHGNTQKFPKVRGF